MAEVSLVINEEAGETDRPEGTDSEPFTYTVGRNLRRLRTQQGYSLERLAKASGVSRAMLGQIETGRSAPTVSTLWKVAQALGVSFAPLLAVGEAGGPRRLPKASAKIVSSSDGKYQSRSLVPSDEPQRRIEFCEIRLAARHAEVVDARSDGTRAHLVVVSGQVEVAIDGELLPLNSGDAAAFDAHAPFELRNEGDRDVVAHLVLTLPARTGF